MPNLRSIWLLLLGGLCFSSAQAQEENYADEARRATALLDNAVKYYQVKGDDAFAAISRQGEFVDRELYVYVVDTHGVMLASGGPSASLIGRNIDHVLGDELKRSIKDALSLPETGETHTAEYHWTNWSDGTNQRKQVFFQRVGERIFAVGYYMPRSSQAEAQALLERASAAVAADPLTTIARVNRFDVEFMQDDLYVFIVDLDNLEFSAHGNNLRLVGSDFRLLQSADKQKIGLQMLTVLKQSGLGEVTYLWRNPANNRIEQKSTLLRKIGKYAVAVGYYLRPAA